MGCARVSAASSDDLPALGSPTRPMSARSLSESVSQSSSPSRPFSANLGAWRVELLKQTLPRPPSPPRATQQALALAHEVAEELAVGVADLGADRHLDEQFGPVGAALVGAAPVAAVGGPEVVLVTEVGEVVQLARRDQHDVAAGRAVAAVGPAFGHVLLAAEAHGAVTAATSAYADAGPVEHVKDEAGERRPLLRPRGRPR